ncbi:MAG: hypothetical protein Q4C73_06110 [Eubacteriales bacterium]|nr:hypothetical protein [Eubacteriales bacterium]
MLGMILGILKIAGIVLLVILGILLAAVLAVLFVPVRYRAEGCFESRLTGKAQVSWLLHAVFFQAVYEDELRVALRIFGIRADRLLYGGSGEESEEADAEPPEFREEAREGASPEFCEPERPAAMEAKHSGREETGRPEPEKAKQPDEEKVAPPKTDRKPETKARRPENQKAKGLTRDFSLRGLWKKIRVTFRGICGKLKTLAAQRDKILAFFQDQDNRQTLSLLKKQAGRFLKHVLPGKIKGRICFGFDDPSTTGQILTWISPFYGWYGRTLKVIPVFEGQALEGELFLKGRIRAASLLLIGFRVWKDKNFRRLLRKWRAA